EANCHLQRDLDTGRAGVREEGARQPLRRETQHLARDFLYRLTRPSGVDDLVQLACLRLVRRYDPRVAQTVPTHPPTRDRIDDAATVLGVNCCTLTAHNGGDRFAESVLGKRMPDRRASHAKSFAEKCCAKTAVKSSNVLSIGNLPR